MNKILDKVIPRIALPIIVAAGLIVILITINNSQSTTDQNNAYVRVINCIISYRDVTRTSDNIEECYLQVEEDLNVKLDRYDSSYDK